MSAPLPVVRPALAPARARAAGFAALAAWGISRWAGLASPSGLVALTAMGVLALGLGLGLARLERSAAGPRLRWVATLGLGLAGLAGVLLLAGAPLRLVADPTAWGSLAAGLGQGIGALPRVTVPYAGSDPWVRTVLLAAGGLLLLLAATLVVLLAPGASVARRARAALPLLVLPAVPGFLLEGRDGTLAGLVLFAALALALWLEEVRSREVRRALLLAAAAAVVGALGVPLLDRSSPWLDYEQLAASLAPRPAARFDWTQRYGPLDWPRTGREVLRVKMRRPVYLKTQNLDAFDGAAWHAATLRSGLSARAEMPVLPRGEDSEDLRVTLRSMASWPVIGAGAITSFLEYAKGAIPAGSPGTYASVSQLEPGDAYRIRVYAPDPAAAELSRLQGGFPGWTSVYRELELPRRGRPAISAEFPTFGQAGAPRVLDLDGGVRRSVPAVRASEYGRAYALARRLARGVSTPWDYAVRVRRFLLAGRFAYVEGVRPARLPLLRFLFADRKGYCQHFAGAAALLLRMGGVPARVATGFTPGVRDGARDEWVVRDTDAHAWVEVWLPRRGWVTLDPTPPLAPALVSQAGGGRGGRTRLSAPSLQSGEPLAAAPGSRDGGGPPWSAILGLLALAAAGFAVVRHTRPQPAVDELEHALAALGRPAPPGATLGEIERRLARTPRAAAYVGALARARYGGGPAPDAAARRAFRRELARGLGPAGRLRAWWALPPRRPGRAAGPPPTL